MTGGDWLLLRPAWLLALPLAWLLLWWQWQRQADDPGPWQQVVDPHLLAAQIVPPPAAGRRRLLALAFAAAALAVVALAGPARIDPQASSWRKDATRVLVVDLSPAMNAVTKGLRDKLAALLDRLDDGQTALVVYAGDAYLAVPPTFDRATLALLLPELNPDVMPVAGDSPDAGLAAAAEVLARNPSSRRDIVWITAGRTDARAAAPGTRISILHIGTPDAPPVDGIVELARRSGGVFAAASTDDRDVEAIASSLRGGAELRRDETLATTDTVDFGPWLLLALLPVAALGFRRGLLGLAVLALLPAPQPATAASLAERRADRQAYLEFVAGRPEIAAAQFADPRWRAAALYRAGRFDAAADILSAFDDAESHYNRGNALARLGRLEAAADAYQRALAAQPGHADARHNLDLIRRQPPPPPPRGGGKPPPADDAKTAAANAEEAARLAEQWQRRVPDDPAGLLRGKLRLEHERRRAQSPAAPGR